MLIRCCAWLGLIGATGLLVRGEARRAEPPKGVQVQRDLVYRVVQGKRLRLDLYSPEGTAPSRGWPLIVAIHGGGWRGGSKVDLEGMSSRFAQSGFVVASVDYRLSRPSYSSWPDNLDDVRESVRWLRRHAGEYKIDPGRVVAFGSSAGGHLALHLGTNSETGQANRTGSLEDSSEVQAVVDLYGPADLELLYRHSPLGSIPVVMLMGNPPKTQAETRRYEDASPISHVTSRSAPTLLIHGRRDFLVPLEQSETLAHKFSSNGVAHRLLVIDSARHGFHLNLTHRDLFPEVVSFLHNVLSPPRTIKDLAASTH
ncbi:alpha/beta hydrolase fold domain-containing protein [Singulisphaera sp. PoT]|uniref:alpha/beta hydrolase fold domain-containing protein n=1 Tax=Singulisphaera sp. PoT TaxID=3411797 RepID=UPI003BF5B149